MAMRETMLSVSNSGPSGDADVAVDAAGILNLGTTSSTAVTQLLLDLSA
jgi:hypothetical protein